MGFLQTIQKDLQESLAVQQRAALVQILRQRAPTMTFDDLREVLSNPLAKGLGPMRVAEAFGIPTQALSEPAGAAAPVTRKKASKAKAAVTAEATPATPRPGKRQAKVKQKQPKKAAKSGKRSPPGVSAEKRAEIDQFDAAVLGYLREVGDWVAAGDVRPRVGGTAETLRLAFKRLAERNAIVREGERASTRYKIAA